MKVLLIGGTRFIGPCVVLGLSEDGHDVAVFHRGESRIRLPIEVEEIKGDRKRLANYREEFRRFAPDVVVDMISLNQNDATGLIETFRGLAARTVVISSGDVYRAYDIVRGLHPGPPDPTPLTEESPLRERLFPYDRPGVEDYEKILVERTVAREPSLPATILRLPAVYGPGDYQRRIFPYLKRMDDGRPTILIEEGFAGWRWTMGYVDDVARAIALAATNEKVAGRIYNVGERDALTRAEFVRTLGEVAGWEGKVVSAPTHIVPDHLRAGLENTEQDLTVATARIRDELSFSENFTRKEALRRTIDWDRENMPPDLGPVDIEYAAEDEAIAKMRR